MTENAIIKFACRGFVFDVPETAPTFLGEFGQASFEAYREQHPIDEGTRYLAKVRYAEAKFGEFEYEIIEYEMRSIWDINALSPIAPSPKIQRKSVPAKWWRYLGRDYKLAYVPELNAVLEV